MTGWDVIVVSIFISIHICFFRDYRSAHVKRKMIASDQHSKIGSILPSSLRDFIEGVLFIDPLRIDPRWSQCQSWVSSWSIWGQIESYPQFAKNISTQQGAFVNQNISKHGPCSETNTGWWFEPLWKNISQLGWLFPIYGKIKNGNQTTNQNNNALTRICAHQKSLSWRSWRLELQPSYKEAARQARAGDTCERGRSHAKMKVSIYPRIPILSSSFSSSPPSSSPSSLLSL